MTQVDCLCILMFLAFICGGNGSFDGVSGDGLRGMCGGGGGGGGVVGGARAGSIGCNQCIALDCCINCLFVFFVQYLPVGGDFSNGGLVVECGGICACGSSFGSAVPEQ